MTRLKLALTTVAITLGPLATEALARSSWSLGH